MLSARAHTRVYAMKSSPETACTTLAHAHARLARIAAAGPRRSPADARWLRTMHKGETRLARAHSGLRARALALAGDQAADYHQPADCRRPDQPADYLQPADDSRPNHQPTDCHQPADDSRPNHQPDRQPDHQPDHQPGRPASRLAERLAAPSPALARRLAREGRPVPARPDLDAAHALIQAALLLLEAARRA